MVDGLSEILGHWHTPSCTCLVISMGLLVPVFPFFLSIRNQEIRIIYTPTTCIVPTHYMC
ncbi:hypothetical protein NC653_019743 [Populus alba x Populus x berolinensis]|uniref:Uncharacterized protein n=1 Tax=Populus alba x Populus x berolinensis TaxID=444605 RepID=A0AAD6VXQ8_9ROSI|nr:hypothetical protein NC653_019289 [Populus alba x Populus x berolinensis]KAJ6991665.1 hypothetical protein NC653_019743 [Populus alba x Populus x berolinensis]